jgi:hypothetical protein
MDPDPEKSVPVVSCPDLPNRSIEYDSDDF